MAMLKNMLMVLTLMALMGCDQAPPGIAGDIDASRAMTFLYGSYDAKPKSSRWKVPALPAKSSADDVLTEGQFAVVSVVLAQQVKEGDQERFYLGVSMVPEKGLGEEAFDCDLCQPVVGASVFVKRDGVWQVEAHEPFVMTLGAHGGGPVMKLVEIGPGRHGILAETDWFQGGNSGTFVSLWTAEQGGIAQRFATQTREDNAGNCSDEPGEDMEPCRESSLDIKYLPGTVVDHYDIRVRPNDVEWTYDNEGHQGELLFRFDGTKYQPLPPEKVQLSSVKVPDSDPVALVEAFLKADAQGLQSSSENWPLVTRFTTWLDGPGWDTSTVVEGAEIADRRLSGRRAEIAVRMRKIGELHADGENMPVLESAGETLVTRRFVLENVGKGEEPHWRIVEPHDGPYLAVDFVLTKVLPNWCGERGCRKTEAYRVLQQHQDVCPPSSIVLNRRCEGAGIR